MSTPRSANLAGIADGFTLAGAAIIVAAELYILWREQIVARREPTFGEPPRSISIADEPRSGKVPVHAQHVPSFGFAVMN